jgi:hypothetical protein
LIVPFDREAAGKHRKKVPLVAIIDAFPFELSKKQIGLGDDGRDNKSFIAGPSHSSQDASSVAPAVRFWRRSARTTSPAIGPDAGARARTSDQSVAGTSSA